MVRQRRYSSRFLLAEFSVLIGGVILGCTEIMLLISPEDCPVPSFDTTTLHAVAAADHALEQIAT